MKIIDCPQYSPTYWQARRGIPSASEAASILTPTGKASTAMITYACQLLADLSDARYGQHEDFVTEAMRNGKALEPAARSWYELERGVDVTECGFCMTDNGKYGCSPDALVGDDGLLELKVPEPHTHVRYLLDGGLPDKYRPQVHMQLVVTGRTWCDFMSYSSGLPSLLVRVERDDYTELMGKTLEMFDTVFAGARAELERLGWTPTDIEIDTAQDAEFGSKEAAALAVN